MTPTIIANEQFRCRIIPLSFSERTTPEFKLEITRPKRMQRKMKLIGGLEAAKGLAEIMGREAVRRSQKPEPEKQPEQLSFA